jgi:hypothetical protein
MVLTIFLVCLSGVYVAFIMGISCVSTILGIFTTYIHHKVTDERPPKILKIIFFKMFARILCMSVPDDKDSQCAPQPSDADLTKNNGFLNKVNTTVVCNIISSQILK